MAGGIGQYEICPRLPLESNWLLEALQGGKLKHVKLIVSWCHLKAWVALSFV